ncbi:SMP-30/gluconolactonase/LRE family protein [Paraburkholderia terrae]|nr:SMP-30/gluconolactonase/LRE family protein [Paraburkholderia terrae]
MRMIRAKTMLILPMLTLLVLLTTPLAAKAWERGKVETFATLPTGEAHPEGITMDREGNVYVVTVAANKPKTSEGTLIVFDPQGKHLRTVQIKGSSRLLLDVGFNPRTGKLLVVDYQAAKVLSVDPNTGVSSVFMTVTGKNPGLDGVTFDAAGNVYVTDAHQGIIWKIGPGGGEGLAWVKSALLSPARPAPRIGANGLAFNNERTALFVANTANDTIVKIPVTGSTLEPGTPEVFVNRAGGGPDGLIIDEHDNIWTACNQSNEILVLEPTQGRVIAKLGDFGGIDREGTPIGFLWSNSLVFHGDDVLVTNLSLDLGAVISQNERTIDGPWAHLVKRHTISKIKKRIPEGPGLAARQQDPAALLH